jgi:hypothetical protein
MQEQKVKGEYVYQAQTFIDDFQNCEKLAEMRHIISYPTTAYCRLSLKGQSHEEVCEIMTQDGSFIPKFTTKLKSADSFHHFKIARLKATIFSTGWLSIKNRFL